jgi:hypothetical protein
MERSTNDSFSAGYAAELCPVVRNCKQKELATMSKVHFLGLDVYEILMAEEAAKPTWEGTVDSPSSARFVCPFRKPHGRLILCQSAAWYRRSARPGRRPQLRSAIEKTAARKTPTNHTMPASGGHEIAPPLIARKGKMSSQRTRFKKGGSFRTCALGKHACGQRES